MPLFFSTEITSSKYNSDRPLLARTQFAYEYIAKSVFGSVLEIGAGEGYGVNSYELQCETITIIDYARASQKKITHQFPNVRFERLKVPPFTTVKNCSIDVVIAFQVLEHLEDHDLFMKELLRVLKPGGKAFLTTPNASHTAVRNPWHFKEYNYYMIDALIKNYFTNFTIHGISGNNLVHAYFDKSKKQVNNLMRLDAFNLVNRLPSSLLKIPYELFNRWNRLKMYYTNKSIIQKINTNAYHLCEPQSKNALDFMCVLNKT